MARVRPMRSARAVTGSRWQAFSAVAINMRGGPSAT